MYDRLITHSGSFHADEVFSAAVLTRLSPEAELIRTRDSAILAPAILDPKVALFDVGDHDDPLLGNFDHHQRTFSRHRIEPVPMASIGLVWAHHGADYVREVLTQHGLLEALGAWGPARVSAITARVEQRLVWSLDAADCGELELVARLRSQPDYGLPVLDMSSIIAMFHAPLEPSAQRYDEQFHKAVAFASVMLEHITLRAHTFFEAAALVEQADDGGPLLLLHQYIPWYEHIKAHHRFVISPASSGRGWMVETVQDDFVPRCPLPEAWAGLRDEALALVSGVEDAIFCHRARFIASALSLEGAQKMVALALESAP